MRLTGRRWNIWILISLLVFVTNRPCHGAFEDPTRAQPFIPWLWTEQITPMFAEASHLQQLSILAVTALATTLAYPNDDQYEKVYGNNREMSVSTARVGSFLGSGAPGVTIAIGQLLFDQANGLLHARSLAFTSVSAISIAVVAQRERPNGKNRLSFPSGHTSSSFATATSLSAAYGYWVGVPAFAIAGFIGASRMAENAHWFSDTVAAAGLGIFWATSSAKVKARHQLNLMPIAVPGGVGVRFEY